VTAFRFEAARLDGASVRGRLDAATRAEAAEILSRRGLLPIAVEPAPTERTAPWNRPPVRALATALRSLSSLLDAGVPLAAALRATALASSGLLAEALGRVEGLVREGRSLAGALSVESGLFSPVTVGLVRAGERGTGLAPALAQAAADMERRADTISQMRAVLAYPVVLLAVGGLSLFGILVLVVPRFASLLSDVRATLPLSTRALIGVSTLVREHVFLFASGVLVVLAAAATAATRLRDRLHEWLLDAPLAGPIRHGLATARSARTLGALLEAGTPALAALRITGETVGDHAVAARLASAAEHVAQGGALSHSLRAARAFTPMALEMAAIGDGVGRLPELLGRAADVEERLAAQRVRTAIALIEPLLICLFAAAVAFVAAALLQAVYSMRAGTL
jgi:type II secretory pathway component PulF